MDLQTRQAKARELRHLRFKAGSRRPGRKIPRAQLEESHELLRAIRQGEVDALMIAGPNGDLIYTLHGAEQPYRQLIEQMRDGAIIVRDGIIEYANRAFAQMVQRPLEQVIGSAICDHVPEADREAFESLVQQCREGSCRIELNLRGSEGTMPVYLSGGMLDMDGGQGISMVVTDLTQQRRGEAVLADRKLVDSLMKQAKEAAEAANAAKDHFLAVLSHELRTPLTPALTMVQIMQADPGLSADQRESLAMISRNIELETRLIDDLLDLTRITRGKVELNLAPTDLHLTLKRVLEMCDSDIRGKQLRVNLALDARRPWVQADAARLLQVIWNVVKNAVKFTPQGGEITLATHDLADDHVVLAVRDTGVGIEADMLPKIFNAFEQGASDTARLFGGLGLGLAISRELVNRQGGTLTASSGGQGKGATFTLMFPSTAAMAEAIPAACANLPPPSGGKGGYILLVEDHRDTAKSMMALLRRMGHRVVHAGTVAAALFAAGSEPFDLIISDIGLPDGSGLDLMRQLRLISSIPGIAISGLGMAEDIRKSSDAGFLVHVTKPIKDLKHFEYRIVEALAMPRVAV
jgi:PAS domain S-box-containing protein